MIAAVTDLGGAVTGVHRTWLALDGRDKAPVAYPRRAMGHLLGNGVRFGCAGPVMVAGEGIETMLSLRQVMRSEEHTSELRSLMRISYAVFCLKKKIKINRCIHI